MDLKVNENRSIAFSNHEQGTSNENNIQILHINLPEKYADYLKKIVFVTTDGTYWDYLENDNSYTIQNNITKYTMVNFYIWLTKDDNDFRTKTYQLFFNENQKVDGEITPEEQTDMERVITILEQEITKVGHLNITAERTTGKVIITLTDKDGNTSVVEVFDGLNGTNGVDGRDGTNGVGLNYNWNGTSLGIKREDEAEYSYTDLKGDTGATGADGKDGKDGKDGTNGADGYTPVKGVDYYTNEEKVAFETEILNDLGNTFVNVNKVKTETNTTAGNVYDVTYINTMLGNIETLLAEV